MAAESVQVKTRPNCLYVSAAMSIPTRRDTSLQANACKAFDGSDMIVSPCTAATHEWPTRPAIFPELLTPVEAAQYLRLDETGTHTPTTAIRTLNYWRQKGELKATKFARRVWFRKDELDRFLAVKTES